MSAPRPLRVVHMAGTANGAPWLIALLREQQARGYDVTAVIAGGDGTIAPILDGHGIRWIAADQDLFSASPLRAWRKIRAMAMLLRRLRPDVVQMHLFPTLAIGRIASWLADVPVRLSTNCGPYTLQSPNLRDIESGMAWMDTATIGSCRLTCTLLVEQNVPAGQVELVYYAVDHSTFDPALADGSRVRRELGIAADTPVIGQVAYFYAPATDANTAPPGVVGRGVKGHDVILRAAPLVLREFPRAKFVFTGGGWGEAGEAHKKEMEALARTLGVDGSVLFTGARADVADVLASFDVALQCSLNENLGGSVEALMMARPTVVSNVGGLPDTVLDGETGVVVPPDDPAALAEAILRLLRDRELGRRLGENGRAFMRERFSLARAASDLEALYARQTARHPRGYRRARMLGRTLLLPFRVLPLLWSVRRRLRARWPLRSRVRTAAPRLLRRALKRTPAAPRSGAPRIAQIAAASSGSPWFADLCVALDRRGYDVVAVIDSSPGDLGPRLEAAGIRVRKVSMVTAGRLDRARLPFYLMRLPFAALKLASVMRAEKIDIAQSHIFVTNVVTRLARLLAPARHIATISGPRHLEAPLTRAVDRATWWLDDLTVGGCRHTTDLYRRLGAREERLDSIYYGADASRFDPARGDGAAFRASLGIGASAPLVGLVAYFYPPTVGPQTPRHTRGVGVKGHESFLDAARIVARRFPEARFVLVGGGSNERGERYRESLAARCRADEVLRDRVVFAGVRDDVPNALAAFDVAVQCSLSEGLGGTLEALLMERPVVATSVGGMPEAVRHEETGLLVPPANADALAAAIERLLADREEAARFARAGRALALQRFTLERTAADIEALYARLATSPSQRADDGARA